MQLNMEVGLLHTDKTWRQDYYIQLNMEAELVNLIGSNLQATNIQQGGSYIGWTFFFVHTVNICIQTQGRLFHSHGMRDWVLGVSVSMSKNAHSLTASVAPCTAWTPVMWVFIR